jgi:lysophospholipid acyltransferase (LPLAT)-like uncharacterized protein
VTALGTRLLPLAAALAVRTLGVTLSVRSEGVEAVRPLWRAGRPLIYAVWHGRILIVPWLNARFHRTDGARSVRVLASRSRDGDIVAAFVERFGMGVVRGSSSRGGAAALRELARAVEGGQDVAVVPDGPRGPSCHAQAGIVSLAATTGAPIVPLGVAARPARRLRSWDRFMVPAPFARCAVVFGPAVSVGRGDDREAVRAAVERALQEATDTADRLVSAS